MLAVAAAVWAGALWGAPALLVVAIVVAIGSRLRPGVAAVLVAVMVAAVGGAVSGRLAADRAAATLSAEIPTGLVTIEGRADTDVDRSGRTVFALVPDSLRTEAGPVDWRGPRLVVVAGAASVAVGDRLRVTGHLTRAPGHLRGRPVAGRVSATTVETIDGPSSWLFRLGNAMRSAVASRWGDRGSPGALLSGFLIGDVERLPAGDLDALRRAGLGHFVAVSGSNVALFLAAWWLASGPLAWGPRRRAALGLVGLVLFVVVTRWEPSVVRAALMAGLVLAGRLVGWWIPPWAALGGAVGMSLLVAGDLASNVGFQLSVVATAGVLLSVGVWSERRPRWLWSALAATIGAQLAVAPLLVGHFGSVPLVAPLTNLVAAPLVAAATVAGGMAVIVEALAPIPLLLAAMVLEIARHTEGLPHLSGVGVASATALVVMASRPRWRPWAVLGAVAVVGVALVPPAWPSGPEVRFLDVGQGDAAVVRGAAGEVVLVDGGPDPRVLRDHLRALDIGRIDVLVISHRHHDHVGGLEALVGQTPVGLVVRPPPAPDDVVIDDLVARLASSGASVREASVGDRIVVGDLVLDVLAPIRRYASPNDGSVVVRLTAGGRTIVFAGDIESVAQSDLGALRADVLKVPHQGAATSDLGWLAASAPAIAVISVGPNDFGHPSAEVVDVLVRSGAQVRRTDLHGTVTVRLDRLS